jgi:hypothetical protein
MTQVFPMIPAPGRSLLFIAAVALLLVAVLALLGYVAYSARQTRFEISPDGLRIAGDLYQRTIPIEQLRVDEARVLDLGREDELRPRFRTFGTGLPGYRSGWYRLRNRQKALLYVTDPARVVYIPTTEGYVLMLSAVQPDSMLAALRAVGAG